MEDMFTISGWCYHHSQLLAQSRWHAWPLTFCIESKPAHCFHRCHCNHVRNGQIWIFHMHTHYYPRPWHLLWTTYQPQYHSWAIWASIYNCNSQDQWYREHHIIIISYSHLQPLQLHLLYEQNDWHCPSWSWILWLYHWKYLLVI